MLLVATISLTFIAAVAMAMPFAIIYCFHVLAFDRKYATSARKISFAIAYAVTLFASIVILSMIPFSKIGLVIGQLCLMAASGVLCASFTVFIFQMHSVVRNPYDPNKALVESISRFRSSWGISPDLNKSDDHGAGVITSTASAASEYLDRTATMPTDLPGTSRTISPTPAELTPPPISAETGLPVRGRHRHRA